MKEEFKTCTKCSEVKPITEFYYRNKERGTRRNDCKACNIARKREWDLANPEKVAKRNRAYRERHPDRVSEQKRRYRESHREELREKNRAYKKANWEKIKAKRNSPQGKARRRASALRCRDRIHAYRQANKEWIKEKEREYYKANRERSLAQDRAWYRANREKRIQQMRAWKEANPGRSRVSNMKRRALQRDASGQATPEQIQARIDYYGGKCWICGAPYTEIDHVKPLSKGGSNWPANLRPACKPCNCSKNDAWPMAEVIRRLGR